MQGFGINEQSRRDSRDGFARCVRGWGLEACVDVGDADDLVVDELLDAEAGQLAAVAGAAHAAEGNVGLNHGRVVDEDHARGDLRCDFLSLIHI